MTTLPHPHDFSKKTSDGEFDVLVEITGSVWMTIRARDLDEAKRLAAEKADYFLSVDFDHSLDDVESAQVLRVKPRSSLYRVMRNGEAILVSHLQPGDVPRDPDEWGF